MAADFLYDILVWINDKTRGVMEKLMILVKSFTF